MTDLRALAKAAAAILGPGLRTPEERDAASAALTELEVASFKAARAGTELPEWPYAHWGGEARIGPRAMALMLAEGLDTPADWEAWHLGLLRWARDVEERSAT